MSTRRNTTLLASVVELLWKLSKRYPADAAVVGGSLVALIVASRYWLHWTWLTVLVFWALALPVKKLIQRELFVHRYRVRRAGESLRWPGRRAALAFRKTTLTRMAETRKQFEASMQGNGFTNAAKIAPALRELDWTVDGAITAVIHPGPLASKGGLRAIMAKRDEIAETCGADGGLRIRPFGKVADSVAPGSARLTFYFERQTWPTLPIQALPPAPIDRVSVGNDEDLNPAHFPLVLAMLLVAMTGKGKSKAIWTLLIGISVKVKNRLFIVDPKGGQEMGPLERLVDRGWIGNRKVEAYGDDSESKAYKVIMAAEAAMKEQQRALKMAGISQWSEEVADRFPLIVLVLDEMLEFLGKISAANKPGKAAEAALLTMLSQGRAAGAKVIMASQASDKEILGNNRTLIPVRFVLGTENWTQTGMAFGDMKAEEHGATCSEIDEPGVGFMKIDGVRGYKKVRVALVEKADIEDFVETGLPANMGETGTEKAEAWRPGWNYRYLVKENCNIDGTFYFAGQLLYVGETVAPVLRHQQHVEDFLRGDPKHYWMKYVDLDAPPLITWAESKEEAVRIQDIEIVTYGPLGNIVLNDKTPWQGKDPVGIPAEQVHPSFRQRFHLGSKGRSAPLPKVAPEPEPEEELEPQLARIWPPVLEDEKVAS